MNRLDPDLRALQEVRDAVARAKEAAAVARRWDQRRVDEVCSALARAGAEAAYDLARLAVEETGIGRVHYKVLKNLLGSEGTWESIAKEKTVGIISRDAQRGVVEIATPVGVIAAIVPTTNPTSTALNKALISLKGRNAVVVSPHPRAKRCIGETIEVLRRALERVGAPADLLVCLAEPTLESTGALMKHRDVSMILATGGSGLVQAAYSSGKPAYGVGPGNVPCYVDRTADVRAAAKAVVSSQSFDNGTLCCSEQALILDRPIAQRMTEELVARGAHLCNEEETKKLERYCNVGGHMNADVVGLDPWKVAERAGFHVPRETTLLLAPQGGVGREFPLSIEILCPLLSVHVVDGWEEGCELSMRTLRFGGLGHTLAFWANDERVIEAFFLEKPANRIVVNGPSSQGATGYSTGLVPAMSLGCGPEAGNITSDNITAKHLVNIKRAAFVRPNWDELERRDHARAAAWTGDAAPRGSGLPGDPGLRGGGGSSARAVIEPPRPAAFPSSYAPSAPPPGLARPSPLPPASASKSARGAASAASKVGAGTKAQPRSAPTFTRPASNVATNVAIATAPSKAASAPPASGGSAPRRGNKLTSDEIRSILERAGSGCPLGPCKGCPHHDVKTGACTA